MFFKIFGEILFFFVQVETTRMFTGGGRIIGSGQKMLLVEFDDVESGMEDKMLFQVILRSSIWETIVIAVKKIIFSVQLQLRGKKTKSLPKLFMLFMCRRKDSENKLIYFIRLSSNFPNLLSCGKACVVLKRFLAKKNVRFATPTAGSPPLIRKWRNSRGGRSRATEDTDEDFPQKKTTNSQICQRPCMHAFKDFNLVSNISC